jgi:hypothetical protein
LFRHLLLQIGGANIANPQRDSRRSQGDAQTELWTRATADSIMRTVSACQFGSWPR